VHAGIGREGGRERETCPSRHADIYRDLQLGQEAETLDGSMGYVKGLEGGVLGDRVSTEDGTVDVGGAAAGAVAEAEAEVVVEEVRLERRADGLVGTNRCVVE